MIAFGCAATSFSQAAENTDQPSDEIVEVIADPSRVVLQGPQARFSLLVHGRTAGGRRVDLTHRAAYLLPDGAPARPEKPGVLVARRNGEASLEIAVAGRKLRVPVQVQGADAPRQFDFADDIGPLLSRFGCNSSACHGKAEGQNGFKLSVFGFDPAADYQALVMEGRGRRVFPAQPERSLLLQKAAGVVPHGGGVRFARASAAYRTLRGWIAAGLPAGGEARPAVEQISVDPEDRTMHISGRQQLRVVAEYSDGSRRDVTHLAQFQANNALASVDERGLVTVGQTPGQVAVMASFRGAVDVFRALIPRPQTIDNYPSLPEANFIDRHVNRQLRRLNILPSPRCDDAAFLRRAYLDIIGTLPTEQEARRFLEDDSPNRRAQLVDRLLERPEYADLWALRWADLLRVDREQLGHKGAYAYYKWIHEAVAENRPFDAMVRELITAEGPLREQPAGYFYQVVTKPGEMASTLSQVFLGVRITCAECHHHPYDRWSQTDYYGMQAFFQQVRSKPSPYGEIVYAEGTPATKHPRTGEAVYPFALGTEMPEEYEATGEDRRKRLAREFTSPSNPWFARNLANRMFAHFLGRGLVEPVDDVRATNPPSNPQLLGALSEYVVEQHYDVKRLIRLITASEAYQRTSEPNATNAADEQNYSRALLRRMPAEVLFDAVCQATGVPESFDGLPSGYRAIELWDSRVEHYFLKIFGRPVRSSVCECERNAEPSMAQVLHLMNSPNVSAKLRHASGTVARLVRETEDDAQLCRRLYLTFLSRFPAPAEQQAAVAHLQSEGVSRREGAEDLAWSLLNTMEFVFNH